METKCSDNTSTDTQETENPAYGLSSKNWLEKKEVENDSKNTSKILNMESPKILEQSNNCDSKDECLIPNNPVCIAASQQDLDCDPNTVPKMNQANFQSHFQQNKMELKARHVEDASETLRHENFPNDTKHGKLSWSALRHRQLSSDILKHCDNNSSNSIEHLTNDKIPQVESQDKIHDPSFMLKTKKNMSFPLSLMRPIVKISDKKTETLSQNFNHAFKNDPLRQRPAQRIARQKFHNSNNNKDLDKSKRLSNDILGLNNPLSDIVQVKTEESVQEWLARIAESNNSSWPDDSEEKGVKKVPQQSSWSIVNSTDEEKGRDEPKHKTRNFHTVTEDTLLQNKKMPDVSRSREKLCFDDLTPKTKKDTTSVLCNATKTSPANVPMVIMQCSRLHNHLDSKPPFQQTSLPMGTLVTALYQESDWLYVQTPHGVEGFVLASNSAPIGTINEPAQARKPWEPCDFPIQVSLRQNPEFSQQQGSYIPAQLPTNNGKQAAPYVSTVKMKTNFYNDRYFSHTFKSKDSIKTAKTVTDILRSSPETKVSN